MGGDHPDAATAPDIPVPSFFRSPTRCPVPTLGRCPTSIEASGQPGTPPRSPRRSARPGRHGAPRVRPAVRATAGEGRHASPGGVPGVRRSTRGVGWTAGSNQARARVPGSARPRSLPARPRPPDTAEWPTWRATGHRRRSPPDAPSARRPSAWSPVPPWSARMAAARNGNGAHGSLGRPTRTAAAARRAVTVSSRGARRRMAAPCPAATDPPAVPPQREDEPR